MGEAKERKINRNGKTKLNLGRLWSHTSNDLVGGGGGGREEIIGFWCRSCVVNLFRRRWGDNWRWDWEVNRRICRQEVVSGIRDWNNALRSGGSRGEHRERRRIMGNYFWWERSLLIMEFMINDMALRIPRDFHWPRDERNEEENWKSRLEWNSLAAFKWWRIPAFDSARRRIEMQSVGL